MDVSVEKLPRIWYENERGDKWIPDLPGDVPLPEPPEGYKYQVSCFPTQVETTYLRVGQDAEGYGFSTEIARATSSFPEDLVLSMINAIYHRPPYLLRTWSLGNAIYIAATACERCLNALSNEYLGPEHGYPEGSEEYAESKTRCRFCEEGDWKQGEPHDEEAKDLFDERSEESPAAPPAASPVPEDGPKYGLRSVLTPEHHHTLDDGSSAELRPGRIFRVVHSPYTRSRGLAGVLVRVDGPAGSLDSPDDPTALAVFPPDGELRTLHAEFLRLPTHSQIEVEMAYAEAQRRIN